MVTYESLIKILHLQKVDDAVCLPGNIKNNWLTGMRSHSCRTSNTKVKRKNKLQQCRSLLVTTEHHKGI